MLEVKQINQYYGGSHILRDVTLQAPVGECSVVLGRNGVGKTTLLKCLMGILPVKSGQILLDGDDITKLSPEQRVHRGLAYVPQGRDIFSTLTVEENILIGMAKFSGSKARHVPPHLYDIFPVLEEMKQRRGGDLSGGQQQQLAIARALASKPRVLILDEPTAGLDPQGRREIMELFEKLHREEGLTTILVTHSMEDAARYAEHVIVMHEGHSVLSGPPESVLTNAEQLAAFRLELPRTVKFQRDFERLIGQSLPSVALTEEKLAGLIADVAREQGDAT